MELGLKGRTALVTGASAGLGFAAALSLAEEGVELIINSRDQGRIDQAAAKIADQTGHKPLAIAADLSSAVGLGYLTERLGELDQPVEILLANSGGPPPGQFLDQSAEAFTEAGRLLLDSAVGLTRVLLPRMIENKFGRLIYLTSIAVLQPIDSLLLSNTYRAAVTGFCKTISNNYAKYGITANCVCPGYTATERLKFLAGELAELSGNSAESVLAGFAEVTPARRLGQPDELAALITFLASDRASYITGTSIPVDGGLNKSLI